MADPETLQFIGDLKHQVQDLSKNNIWLRNRLNYYRKQNDSLANKTFGHVNAKVDSNLKRSGVKKDYISMAASMDPNANESRLEETSLLKYNSNEHLTKTGIDLASIHILRDTIESHLHANEDLNRRLELYISENAIIKEKLNRSELENEKLKDRVKDKKLSRKHSSQKDLDERDQVIEELRIQLEVIENQQKAKELHSTSVSDAANDNSKELELEIQDLNAKLSKLHPIAAILKSFDVSIPKLKTYLQFIKELEDKDVLESLLQNPSQLQSKVVSNEFLDLKAELNKEIMKNEALALENSTISDKLHKLSESYVDKSELNGFNEPLKSEIQNVFQINIKAIENADMNSLICLCIPRQEPILLNAIGTTNLPIGNLRQFLLSTFISPIQAQLYFNNDNKLELVGSMYFIFI